MVSLRPPPPVPPKPTNFGQAVVGLGRVATPGAWFLTGVFIGGAAAAALALLGGVEHQEGRKSKKKLTLSQSAGRVSFSAW